MKNSKKSDRELARSLGYWQSTITRHRKRLENEDVIREYTVIPNLRKLGYEIFAFQLIKFWRPPPTREIPEHAWNALKEWLDSCPEVIFATRVLAQQGQWDVLVVSLHLSYADFSEYVKKLFHKCRNHIQESVDLLSGGQTTKDILKPFSLRYLEKKHIYRTRRK